MDPRGRSFEDRALDIMTARGGSLERALFIRRADGAAASYRDVVRLLSQLLPAEDAESLLRSAGDPRRTPRTVARLFARRAVEALVQFQIA